MLNNTNTSAPKCVTSCKVSHYTAALSLILLTLFFGCATYDEAFRHYAKGTNFFKVGRFEEAITEFDKSIQFEEEKKVKSRHARNYYLMRASARNSTGDFEGAISDYTEVLKIQPYYKAALLSRGIAKEKKGDFEEAISDYTQVIKLNPRDGSYYSYRGLAKQSAGNFNGAISDFNKALRYDRSNTAKYFKLRARAKRLKGDMVGAITDMKRSRELSGNVKK